MSTITKDYARQQRTMHQNERYGRASLKWAPMVVDLIRARDPLTILDYGCGKGALRKGIADALDGRVMVEYDPGVKEFSELPGGSFDMVCCIDVLEHVEPECIEDVLDALRDKVGGFGFFTIHTGAAGKELPDGRNAHLIQQPFSWWQDQLSPRFKIPCYGTVHETIWVVCV